MPESVTDRPTKAHEYVFLLSKRARYFYDAEAVREPATCTPRPETSRTHDGTKNGHVHGDTATSTLGWNRPETGRNLRSVWMIATQPYPEAHFATFPEALVVPCIKAGTSEHGCCAGCGAPWGRVVDKPQPPEAMREREPQKMAYHTRAVSGGGGKIAAWYAAHPSTTTGWRPTCACDADVVPCTVLDPFAGSGTVLLVANALGRHALGIEANPAYTELARERTAQAALL